jgi:hypothetical protein
VQILTGIKAQMLQAFAVRLASGGEEHVVVVCEDGAGTQFTCFTRTKVRILTERSMWIAAGTEFTGFTGTKVQILALQAQCGCGV